MRISKKNLKSSINNESLVPVFQDEVHFKLQSTVTRKWAMRGSEPKIMSKPGKQSVAYSGYLIPETGALIVDKPIKFNYLTVIESIRNFISSVNIDAGKKFLLILDNAPWHKKAIRLIQNEEEFKDIRSKVQLLTLPPYSPDLNPIEQVWRITRREKTHNRYFNSLSLLTEVLDSFFVKFAKGSEQLKSLCNFGSITFFVG